MGKPELVSVESGKQPVGKFESYLSELSWSFSQISFNVLNYSHASLTTFEKLLRRPSTVPLAIALSFPFIHFRYFHFQQNFL